MRRLLLMLSLAALVLAALPAGVGAADEPEADRDPEEEEQLPEEPELQECENPEGLEVITIEGLESSVATPSFIAGAESEYAEFILDLSPAVEGTTATLSTTMTWTVPLNDYDLTVYGDRTSGVSENYQPFDPAEENVTLGKLAHCSVVEVEAYDYLAPAVVDSLLLDFVVSAVQPPAE